MQVTISEDDHLRAAERAAAHGISLAEYLRRLVRSDLADDAEEDRPDVSELFGIGDSGGSDVAVHKDDYLADAIGSAKTSPRQ